VGKIGGIFDKWFGRFANGLAFWPFVFPTGVGALIAYFSTGVSWIAALGPFGWVSSGLVGFFLVSAGLAMTGRSRLYRVEAKIRERISGDSSPFDPMVKVFQNKRLYLRDLAPLGRKRVLGKKFIDCEIIGPGTAIIGLDTNPQKYRSVMKECNTFDVDCIEIDPSTESALAIGFWDCDFEGCNFYHMTLLFALRSNETLNWITRNSQQPSLIEDQRNGEQS
jgi:hypothetical protein